MVQRWALKCDSMQSELMSLRAGLEDPDKRRGKDNMSPDVNLRRRIPEQMNKTVFTLGCEVAVVLFATNSRHTYSEEHHGILNTLRFDELFQRLADGMKPKICFDIYGCSPRQPWKFYLTIQSIGLISVGESGNMPETPCFAHVRDMGVLFQNLYECHV